MGLVKRQFFWYGDNSNWEVKWAIVGAVVLAVMLVLMIAYGHARSRMARGLDPLRYHAWLVRGRMQYLQAQRERNLGEEGVQYREFYTTYPTYPMSTFNTPDTNVVPPPPAYDPRYPAPPLYVPPEGKPYEAPPPGPPPNGASSAYTPYVYPPYPVQPQH